MKWSRKPTFENKIKAGNAKLESVYSFTYLKATVNSNNVT
jgi:hypothetical protein